MTANKRCAMVQIKKGREPLDSTRFLFSANGIYCTFSSFRISAKLHHNYVIFPFKLGNLRPMFLSTTPKLLLASCHNKKILHLNFCGKNIVKIFLKNIFGLKPNVEVDEKVRDKSETKSRICAIVIHKVEIRVPVFVRVVALLSTRHDGAVSSWFKVLNKVYKTKKGRIDKYATRSDRNKTKVEENRVQLAKNGRETRTILCKCKESERFKEWETHEDGFQLEQAQLRSKIRIQDGRAKYINIEDEDLAVEMHEPLYRARKWEKFRLLDRYYYELVKLRKIVQKDHRGQREGINVAVGSDVMAGVIESLKTEEFLSDTENIAPVIDELDCEDGQYSLKSGAYTGFEWNKYNQTHYDMENPPSKII
uniref:Splicing factor Cactin n=1 Tax=Strigamia maritima TaxID=126957 RepID=T1IU64_STRMM